MGSTGTASSDYTFAVQWAKIMNQYVPNLDVTVVETASSIENLQRMARGEFALNIYGNPDSTYTALHGIPPFQGTPPTKQRDLFAWSKNICYIMVRTDSGITNLAGLEGKKVATGPPGSATMDYSQRCLAALNIKPDWQPQSFADGSAALKDKRVVGYTKSFATSKVDASVLDILATTKVTLLPFTADQRATVQKTAPWIPWYDVTAGWWKEFPDVPAHITFGFAAATGAHADLISNDIAYAIMAASTEHMSDWTWPACAGGRIKPLDTMLEMLKNMPEPPWLHAGAVKYYKDKGYTVPANIISPEYKG